MAKHRGHLEGTIAERTYTRKDGTKVTRFVAQLPLDGNGKRPSLGNFKTRSEAREALKSAELARAQGITITGKVPTVKEWLEQWLAGRTRLAHRTRIDYRHTWQTVFPYIGHLRLDHVTENDLGEMWVKLAQGVTADGASRTPMAATTLATKHAHVNAAFRAAVRSRHVAITYNPAGEARPERGERKDINPLSEDEVRRLFAATREDPEFPLWVTLITTGCRPSELRALRWQDVHLEERTVSINGSLYRKTGTGHVRGATKTKTNRVVSLRPETVRALMVQKVRQAEARLAAGPAWNDHGYIFTRADGSPIDENGLRRAFDLACAKAGIPRRTLKETRHTFATLALARGVPVKVVSEALGHSSVTITYDVYSHIIPGMQGEYFSYLDRLFASS